MSNFLNDIADYIKEKGYNVYSIAIIENAGEAQSIQLKNVNACQDSYSVAKAFTMTAVGILFDRGLLKLDSKVVDLLGDECPENLDERWQKVTVKMILKHRVGLKDGSLDIDCFDSRTFGEDYLDFWMHKEFLFEPDEDRLYSDGAYYLLARIVEKLAGENLSVFLWKNLFYKLGFREVAWSNCPKGHCMGATGLYIRSEDMVKLGEIYLEGGTYHGERIVSREWTELALGEPFELSKCGIGNAYGKGGMHCQNLFVDPDKKRVVAYHSYDDVDNGDLIRFTVEYE